MHDTFPLPDLTWDATRPYYEAAARGDLAIPKCDECGRFVWYPREHCGGERLTWVPTSGQGRLFAWTVVRHAFLPQFRDLVPFVTALVSLEEDAAVRIVTRIVDCAVEDLAADMPLRAVFRPLRFPGVDGEVVAPLFTPSDL
jgi:uncharacterized OB-fold protein